MAGLIDYVMMGFALSGAYIGIKYGPQIISNMQSSSQQQQQPVQAQQEQQQPITTDQTGQPVASIDGSTQTNTRTYPHSTQNRARHLVPINHPSNDHGGSNPIIKKRSIPLKPNLDDPNLGIKASAIDAQQNCVCNKKGVWVQSKPGQPVCDLVGLPCSGYGGGGGNDYDYDYDFYEANLGYANSYVIPVEGPQWRKSIPYNELVASVGMSSQPGQGRVRRALAANNHNFMPAGFTLSESSVRRGFNNVYSAGT